MTDQGPRKPPAIPSWQQNWQSSAKEQSSSSDNSTTQPPATAEPSLLDQARTSLEHDSIRDASRERKVEFLRNKGLEGDETEKLLGLQQASADDIPELKTVHDTTQVPDTREQSSPSPDPSPPSEPSSPPPSISKRDIPPIITYPEFLLKPQKPPPLVTFERLANAAYALAGVSALTWGASKYIVQPMLESLTEARLSLAETAKADLETLNTKLESTVSHVPYIPTLALLHQEQKAKEDEDLESDTSDPTELFHRDIATQTSPHPSRTQSFDYMEESTGLPAQDPTTSQSSRLRSLHSTLSSLLSSQTTHFSQDRFSTSLSDFQSTLDKLESSYNPFAIDYTSSYSNYSGPGASSSSTDKDKNKKPADNSEATKFKNEIRALKGAFLSSRNFPTARPAQPFTLPVR
ncbi:hypothetical protein H2200_002286 [Cladophialophora chaetospira]|uniref:Peroxisomal membrane protein PEX14 n=1 Tax=Cladophialophora chaetospira TaxID=386627 RepID=A0AA39CNE1_9EURO|nr:hypothetical protein H2200_002286 [Cladophialophora chaetospira]